MTTVSNLVVISVLMVFIISCSSHNKSVQAIPCSIDNAQAPQWVCGNENSPDYIYVTGFASIGKLGKKFSEHEARIGAFSNLATVLQPIVQTQVEEYQRYKSDVDQQRSTSLITQKLADFYMSKGKQINKWQHPSTNTLYIMLGIEKKILDKDIDELFEN